VNAAENDEGASLFRKTPYCVAPKSIAGVNADADNIARVDRAQIERSRVSSQRIGFPNSAGVAAANTNNQRGVMTAVPKQYRSD
jgi:hypothetical protein